MEPDATIFCPRETGIGIYCARLVPGMNPGTSGYSQGVQNDPQGDSMRSSLLFPTRALSLALGFLALVVGDVSPAGPAPGPAADRADTTQRKSVPGPEAVRDDFRTDLSEEDFDAFSFQVRDARAVKVIVDRRPGDRVQATPRVYFLNHAIYELHIDFLLRNRLVPTDEARNIQLETWRDENRRFIFAQVARYEGLPEGVYTVELAEEDRAPAAIVVELMARIQEHMGFGKLVFKPNSVEQAALRKKLTKHGVEVLKNDALSGEIVYQVVHAAPPAVGKLRIVTETDPVAVEAMVFNRNDIVLLQVVPNDITRVAGIITTRPTTPLSHVAMRARGWNIPVVTWREALTVAYREGLEDAWVCLEVPEQGLPSLRRASSEEVALAEAQRMAAQKPLRIPRADLTVTDLVDLSRLRADDVVSVGAKAANLGEVAFLTQELQYAELEPILSAVQGDWLEDAIGPTPRRPARLSPRKLARAYLSKLHVPPGFAIPFSAYHAFLNHPPNAHIVARLDAMLEERRFHEDVVYRKEQLAELRALIRDGEIPPNWSRRILTKIHNDFPDRRLFIRSSTNAEDLEDFNGAGLYDTVGNVEGDAAILQAIKRVWASVWNFRAYEARADAGISHRAVYPGVLVQEAVHPFAAGVLVTKDILSDKWNNRFYLNANPGFGENTVQTGRGAPEQIYGDPFTGEVLRISLSERGGALLTDTEVRQLVFFAAVIEQHFGRRRGLLPYPQDIEWLVVNGRVSIVQTRPYHAPEM